MHASMLSHFSHVQLFMILWTVAYQAPPFMGFSRQEYWSGLPFPSSGDLPSPGIEPRSAALQADTLPSEPMATAKLTNLDKFLLKNARCCYRCHTTVLQNCFQ